MIVQRFKLIANALTGSRRFIFCDQEVERENCKEGRWWEPDRQTCVGLYRFKFDAKKRWRDEGGDDEEEARMAIREEPHILDILQSEKYRINVHNFFWSLLACQYPRNLRIEGGRWQWTKTYGVEVNLWKEDFQDIYPPCFNDMPLVA